MLVAFYLLAHNQYDVNSLLNWKHSPCPLLEALATASGLALMRPCQMLHDVISIVSLQYSPHQQMRVASVELQAIFIFPHLIPSSCPSGAQFAAFALTLPL